MIADTSGGCEPEFSLIWYKNVMNGTHLPYVLEYFAEVAKREGFYYDGLMDDVLKNNGSARGIKKVPEKWQKIFATAMDMTKFDAQTSLVDRVFQRIKARYAGTRCGRAMRRVRRLRERASGRSCCSPATGRLGWYGVIFAMDLYLGRTRLGS